MSLQSLFPQSPLGYEEMRISGPTYSYSEMQMSCMLPQDMTPTKVACINHATFNSHLPLRYTDAQAWESWLRHSQNNAATIQTHIQHFV